MSLICVKDERTRVFRHFKYLPLMHIVIEMFLFYKEKSTPSSCIQLYEPHLINFMFASFFVFSPKAAVFTLLPRGHFAFRVPFRMWILIVSLFDSFYAFRILHDLFLAILFSSFNLWATFFNSFPVAQDAGKNWTPLRTSESCSWLITRFVEILMLFLLNIATSDRVLVRSFDSLITFTII